jgi:hypothetical protein
MNIATYTKFRAEHEDFSLEKLAKEARSMRINKEKPIDVTFEELIQSKLELDLDDFYLQLGIDPGVDTIDNLFAGPDEDVRWLVPEIIRDALRLGYRQAPIWGALTAIEETTGQLQQILPSINMADAAPKRVGEGETIPLGNLSYQDKTFRIHKFGRGVALTDEIRKYVNLNVLSYFLQDFGVKMGLGVDTLAVNTLINGEQSDGSAAAPVVGIATPNTLAFRDILKIWIRMSKIGRTPKLFVGGEDMALETMDLEEFSKTDKVASPEYNLNVKMPKPTGADYYIHASIPAKQHIIVDPTAALIKLTAVPMMVESERIVSNQTEAFYATTTTGFAKLFHDSAIIQDYSKDIAEYPIPDSFNWGAHQVVNME